MDLTFSQAEGQIAPPVGSLGTCDSTEKRVRSVQQPEHTCMCVCVCVCVRPHSSDLLLRHFWWDASDEQGGGEVEGAWLSWHLLCLFFRTFCTHTNTHMR